MAPQQSSHTERDFFTVAAEQNLLSAEVAHELAREASARDVHPTQIVLQKGLLDVVEIDIIETLLHATETSLFARIGRGGWWHPPTELIRIAIGLTLGIAPVEWTLRPRKKAVMINETAGVFRLQWSCLEKHELTEDNPVFVTYRLHRM